MSMRFCPECKTRTEKRLCPEDGTPTLVEAAFKQKKADPLIGTVFDERYEVLERIGKGGMGSVYRARQLTMGREVALKVLNPDLAEDAEAAGRFVREAKVASFLRHPNTIVLYDFGHTTDGLFMAMELLHGENLLRRLSREGPMDPREVARIGAAIATSLAEAHAQGIVHRDLKPANIFLHRVHGGKEVVKVLDFGVAKFLQDQRTRAGESLFETNRPMLVGTVQYMSPEQIKGDGLDGRSDLYALGVILYECLSGKRPFDGDTPIITLRLHLDGELEPLPESVPPQLRSLVHRLLAKKPGERPQTAEDAAHLLDGFFSGELPAITAEALDEPTRAATPAPVMPQTTRAAPIAAGKGDDWGAFAEPANAPTKAVPGARWQPPPRTASGVPGGPATGPATGPNTGPAAGPPSGPSTRPAERERAVETEALSRPASSRSGLWIVLFIALALGVAYLFVRERTVEGGSKTPGVVSIEASPNTATIKNTADGTVLGTGHVELRGDVGAPKRIAVSAKGYATRIIDLKYPESGQRQSIDVPLAELRRVELTSDPDGATITWMETDTDIGTTDFVWAVPETAYGGDGVVTLRFSKPGYVSRVEKLTAKELKAGRGLTLKLQPGGIGPGK